MKEGTKYDNGKPPVAEFLLDFAPEIMDVAKVWQFGANKYAKSNWKKVENGKTRYMNALMRHLLLSDYEPVDEESGMSHLVHVVFNALAVLHFEGKEQEQQTCLINHSEDHLNKVLKRDIEMLDFLKPQIEGFHTNEEYDKLRREKAACLGEGLRYKDALLEIATQHKISSIGYGTEDNSFEVETAREALGMPLDIPKYDDPDYEEGDDDADNS